MAEQTRSRSFAAGVCAAASRGVRAKSAAPTGQQCRQRFYRSGFQVVFMGLWMNQLTGARDIRHEIVAEPKRKRTEGPVGL